MSVSHFDPCKVPRVMERTGWNISFIVDGKGMPTFRRSILSNTIVTPMDSSYVDTYKRDVRCPLVSKSCAPKGMRQLVHVTECRSVSVTLLLGRDDWFI